MPPSAGRSSSRRLWAYGDIERGIAVQVAPVPVFFVDGRVSVLLHFGCITQYPGEPDTVDYEPAEEAVFYPREKRDTRQPLCYTDRERIEYRPQSPVRQQRTPRDRPVIESYPSRSPSVPVPGSEGDRLSLMPNTAPNILNSSMIEVSRKFSTPILRISGLLSIFRAFLRKLTVPISNALLSFRSRMPRR